MLNAILIGSVLGFAATTVISSCNNVQRCNACRGKKKCECYRLDSYDYNLWLCEDCKSRLENAADYEPLEMSDSLFNELVIH